MVRIIQCLCPARHCIVAMAYDPARTPAAESLELFRSSVAAALQKGEMDRWCGLCGCGSDAWHYEDGPTRFATLGEAAPALAREAAAQARARAALEAERN